MFLVEKPLKAFEGRRKSIRFLDHHRTNIFRTKNLRQLFTDKGTGRGLFPEKYSRIFAARYYKASGLNTYNFNPDKGGYVDWREQNC